MDVSIIIVNYKTSNLVFSSVESIIEYTRGVSYEIIVVDNSESYEEISALRSNLKEKAVVIDAFKNVGFGAANNIGSNVSKGRYLFFLNSDTRLANNAIYELFIFLENNKNVGVTGSNLLTENEEPNHSFEKKEKNVKNEAKYYSILDVFFKKMLKKRSDYNYSSVPKEIYGYVCGAALMIEKETFLKIGGFDERIFMYAEEALLCFKVIHSLNLKIYNIPSSRIIHLEGSSFNDKMSIKKYHYFIDGNVVYYETAFGCSSAIKYLKIMRRVFRRNRFFAKFIRRNKEKASFFAELEEFLNNKIVLLLESQTKQ